MEGQRKAVLLADALLLIPVFVWGATFTLLYKLIEDGWKHAEFTYLAARFCLSTLLFAPLAIPQLRKAPQNRASYLVAGISIGCSLSCFYFLQVRALSLDTPSTIAFVTSLSVVFVPLGTFLFFRRRPGKCTTIGVVLVCIGLLMFVQNWAFKGGAFLTTIGATALAVDILLVSRFARKLDVIALTFVTTCALAFTTAVGALVWEVPKGLPSVSWHLIAVVAYTSILGTNLCFLIQARAQKFASPTHAAIILSLEPVVTALTSSRWTGERFTLEMISGGALIVIGTIIAEVGTIERGEGTNCE